MQSLAEYSISSELQSGERLIWSGKPPKGIRLRSSDIVLVPFSLLWGGFAFFWEYSVIKTGFIPFVIFGIPFVLMGLYLIFGRFVVDSWQREKTIYGLTNERVIIISGLFGKKIKSLNLKTLSDISLSEKTSSGGIITFGSNNPIFSWLGNSSWPGFGDTVAPHFELETRVKNVYGMIRDAQRNA